MAGFPLFLFLLTLRNISVNKLPVLSSHAPHLIIDTCLSKTERETDQDRTFQAFQEFLSVVTQKCITCNVRKLFFKGDSYICSHSICYIFHQKSEVMNLTYHFFFFEQNFLGKTHSFRVLKKTLKLDETHRSESVKTLNCAKKQTDEVLLHPFFYRWVSR